MLSAIFEEAKLTAKADASVASGDWSGWTVGELDNLAKDGDLIDDLIGKIVKSDREFPDTLWEAMRRRYSDDQLSNCIKRSMVDGEVGKLHLDQSYWDRIQPRDQSMLADTIRSLARHHYGYRKEPWPDAEIEKAKDFTRKIEDERSAKNREEYKASQARAELHPTMTEHWRRLLPDNMPTEVSPWDLIRSKLKTKDKQQIDMVLREMEKNGLITQNEHGNKMFDPAKYQELMDRKKTSYPIRVNKDFRGTYHNTQMIRGSGADAAQVSVGLPDATETKWKTEHPKLYDFLKMLRSKKEGNHSSMMNAKQAIGWVRIDKLSTEDWLIEELQQDIDDVLKAEVGKKLYGANSHEVNHKREMESAKLSEEALKDVKKAMASAEAWLKVVEQHDKEWRQWETQQKTPIADLIYPRSIENNEVDARLPQSLKSNFGLLKKAYEDSTAAYHRSSAAIWLNLDTTRQQLIMLENAKEMQERVFQGATKNAEKHKKDMDSGTPETPETQAWLRDHPPVKEFLKEFPRMAMHAVKVAAKQHGVKRLWWVTRSQKVVIGSANPPLSSTSDALAKKFGFRKVPWEELMKEFKRTQATGLGTVMNAMQAHRHVDQAIKDNPKLKETQVDDYLWMVPVDEMVTEARVPLDISLFG